MSFFNNDRILRNIVSIDDKNSASSPKKTNSSGQKAGTKTYKPVTNLERPNPLGNYASYTYQITWYMSTVEAINNFILNGGVFDPKDKHYIIAQSGGFNRTEKRALTDSGEFNKKDANGKIIAQQGMDLYIDDLEIKTTLPGTLTSHVVPTDIRFKVVEPIGFNFLNKLAEASGQINNLSSLIRSNIQANSKSAPPPLSQNYIIAIRFFGYDENGQIILPSKTTDNLYKNKQSTSLQDSHAVYERFFTFNITSLNYQLADKIVTYYVEGAPISKIIGQGTKFGLVKNSGTIVAGTVAEALSGNSPKRSLIQILNAHQQAEKNKNNIKNPIEYEIEWGDDTKDLQNGRLIDDPANSSATTPGKSVKSTKDVTVKTAAQTQSMDVNRKEIPVKQGTNVIMLMDNILAKNTYIANTLIADNNEKVEAEMKKNSPTTFIKWYSINPIVTITGRDSSTNDWSYKVKYRIDMRPIQYLNSLYKSSVAEYVAPHKRYNYIFTGQNTEILSFEQKYDTQFYITKALTVTPGVENPTNSTPAQPEGGSQGVSLASQQFSGSEIINNTAVRLDSPADQASASIKILGDPEYLLSNTGGLNVVNSRAFQSNYNSSEYMLNPYKGQILIEIVFKGANDYKSDGTLNLLDVDFYTVINSGKIDKTKLKPKGIVYRVIEVTNHFSGGKFTQDLDLVLVMANQLNLPTKVPYSEARPTYEFIWSTGGR